MKVGFEPPAQLPSHWFSPQVTTAPSQTPGVPPHSTLQGPAAQLNFVFKHASLSEQASVHSCPSEQPTIALAHAVAAAHSTLQFSPGGH